MTAQEFDLKVQPHIDAIRSLLRERLQSRMAEGETLSALTGWREVEGLLYWVASFTRADLEGKLDSGDSQGGYRDVTLRNAIAESMGNQNGR